MLDTRLPIELAAQPRKRPRSFRYCWPASLPEPAAQRYSPYSATTIAATASGQRVIQTTAWFHRPLRREDPDARRNGFKPNSPTQDRAEQHLPEPPTNLVSRRYRLLLCGGVSTARPGQGQRS